MASGYLRGTPILNVHFKREVVSNYDNEDLKNEQEITLKWETSGENTNYYIIRRKDGEDWQTFDKNDPSTYLFKTNVGQAYFIDKIYGELDNVKDENGNDLFDEDGKPILKISDKGLADLRANYVYCVFKLNEKSTENVYNYEFYVTAKVVPPTPCTNFNVENTSNGVIINWTDSIDIAWQKSILVRKLIIDDTTTKPKDSNDGVQLTITSITGVKDYKIENSDGTIEIYSQKEKPKNYYIENKYIDETASPFKYYYYTLFTIDIYGNETASECLTGGVLDIISPGVAKFNNEYESGLIVNLDSGIELYWDLPNDDDIAGVKLVRVEIAQDDEKYIKLDPYRFAPDKPNDGEVIYEGVANYYADKTAMNGVKYCYKLFPYDKSGNYNTKSDSVIKSIDCEFKVESMKIIPRYFDQGDIYYRGNPIEINKDYNQFGFEIRCNVGNGAAIPLYIVRTVDDYDNIFHEDELIGQTSDGHTTYTITPKYVKYKPKTDIICNNDGTYDIIFYDFNSNNDDWNTEIEDNIVYYYTSYILTHTEDEDGTIIPIYYRQELGCVRKIDFAIYEATLTDSYMEKFNTYFNSYNTIWRYGPSLTNNLKLLPYFTSNTTNATLSLNKSQNNRNNVIENIQFISFNCEYSGWISYGYMDADTSFTNNNDYIQLYNQSFRQIQTELNDYNIYKYLTKCFYIENENINDNYMPAIKVDKNSKLMIDSVVISYLSYDPSLEDQTNGDDDIFNGNGMYTVIEIVNDPLGDNISQVNKDTVIKINRLIGKDIEKIVIGGITIDGSKIKQGESYEFHFCMNIDDETIHEGEDNWLKMGVYQMHIFGTGYSFEGTTYNFQKIKLQNKNILTYNSMFKNCSGLTKMPSLYQGVTDCSEMFKNCVNLTWDKPPVIPRRVSNLSGMFEGCTNIEVPPSLPYNSNNCSRMFANCSKLKYVPDFRTTLVSSSSSENSRTNLSDISEMFVGCKSDIKFIDLAIPEIIFGSNYSSSNNIDKKSETFKKVNVNGCFKGCKDIINNYYLSNTDWVK